MKFMNLVRNQWDRSAAFVCAVAGALVLLLGYIGMSGTPYTPEQLPYLVSGGAFGLFLLGLAAVLWLTADLRDEWRKLDDIDNRLNRLVEHAEDEAEHRARAAAAVPDHSDFTDVEIPAVAAKPAARRRVAAG